MADLCQDILTEFLLLEGALIEHFLEDIGTLTQMRTVQIFSSE